MSNRPPPPARQDDLQDRCGTTRHRAPVATPPRRSLPAVEHADLRRRGRRHGRAGDRRTGQRDPRRRRDRQRPAWPSPSGSPLLAMAYTIGHVSGCHINPAVTLAFFLAARSRIVQAVLLLGRPVHRCAPRRADHLHRLRRRRPRQHRRLRRQRLGRRHRQPLRPRLGDRRRDLLHRPVGLRRPVDDDEGLPGRLRRPGRRPHARDDPPGDDPGRQHSVNPARSSAPPCSPASTPWPSCGRSSSSRSSAACSACSPGCSSTTSASRTPCSVATPGSSGPATRPPGGPIRGLTASSGSDGAVLLVPLGRLLRPLPLADAGERLRSGDVGDRARHVVAELTGGARASRRARRPGSWRGRRRRCATSRRRSRGVRAGGGTARRPRRRPCQMFSPRPAVVRRRGRCTARGCAGRATPGSGGSPASRSTRRRTASTSMAAMRGGVEMAEAAVQRRRSGEGPLHRHLLVEEHADQQRGAVGVEQPVGLRVAGDVQRACHAPRYRAHPAGFLHSPGAAALVGPRRHARRGVGPVVPAGLRAAAGAPRAAPAGDRVASWSTVRATATVADCRRGAPTARPSTGRGPGSRSSTTTTAARVAGRSGNASIGMRLMALDGAPAIGGRLDQADGRCGTAWPTAPCRPARSPTTSSRCRAAATPACPGRLGRVDAARACASGR